MKRCKELIIILLFFTSCSKSNDHHSTGLSGVFSETFPENGRSHLIFVEGNIVIKAEAGSDLEDSYKYRIINDTIVLIPTWNESLMTEFQFKRISSTKFQIENIFPDIPENPTTYMTFEK